MAKSRGEANSRAFDFLKVNERQTKPRSQGLTEIRGPYYTPMGKRSLQDMLETMGAYVDALKFAAGSFSLMPRQAVKELSRGMPQGDPLSVDYGGVTDRHIRIEDILCVKATKRPGRPKQRDAERVRNRPADYELGACFLDSLLPLL